MKMANSKKLATIIASVIFLSLCNFSHNTGNIARAMEDCEINFDNNIEDKIRWLYKNLKEKKILPITDEISKMNFSARIPSQIAFRKSNIVENINKNFWELTNNQQINRAIIRNDGTLEYYRDKELVFSTADADKIHFEPGYITFEVKQIIWCDKNVIFVSKGVMWLRLDCTHEAKIKEQVRKFILNNNDEIVLKGKKISLKNWGKNNAKIILTPTDYQSNSLSKEFYVNDIKKVCYNEPNRPVLKYYNDNKEIFDKNFEKNSKEAKYNLQYLYDYKYISSSESENLKGCLTELDAFNLGIKFRLDYCRRLSKGLIEILYNNNNIDFDYIEVKKNNNTNEVFFKMFKNNQIIDDKNYNERDRKLLKELKEFDIHSGWISENIERENFDVLPGAK